jgi:CspA family cold shock protein
MPTGTVKFFNDFKGYGFIQQDGGATDAFVHISAVEGAGMSSLRENQRLAYDLEQDSRGRTSAVNLHSVESEQTQEPRERAKQAPEPAQPDGQAERAL